MSTEQKSSIEIREINAGEEMRAVEDLQKIVWGIPDLDVVSAQMLVASTAAGGILLGAFQEETLVGFVYGFVGFEHGKPIHHSHMLAILPEYRRFNLGGSLKLAQREHVLKQGIAEMTWTFDPLQSRNAHINFFKLGVVSKRYLVNFYGEDAPSFLHRNGTDRLWVTWLLDSERVTDRISDGHSRNIKNDASSLVEIGNEGAPNPHDLEEGLSNELVSIEIPGDINSIEKANRELAFEWRLATRRAFTKAMAAGFLVEEYYRNDNGDMPSGQYILVRDKGLEDIL